MGGGAPSSSQSSSLGADDLEGAFIGEITFFDELLESISLNGCVRFDVSNVIVMRPSCSAIDNFK